MVNVFNIFKGNRAAGSEEHYNLRDTADALRGSKSQLPPGSEAKVAPGTKQGFGKDESELKGESGLSGPGGIAAPDTKQGFGKYGNEHKDESKPPSLAVIAAPITKQGFGKDRSEVKGESKLPGPIAMAAPGTKKGFGKDGNEVKEESSPSESGCIAELCPKKWFGKDGNEKEESRPFGPTGMADVKGESKPSGSEGIAAPVNKGWFGKGGNEVKRGSRPPGSTATTAMTSPDTEQGFYSDKNDGLRKINSQDSADNLYGNEDRRRKRGRNEGIFKT